MRSFAITEGAGKIETALVRAVQAIGWRAASIDLAESAVAELSLIVDVQDEAALAAAMAQIGPLRGLVCIAGTDAQLQVEDLSWDEWRRVMAVNVTGTMSAIKHARMRQDGAMVLTSSVSAHFGNDGDTAHLTSMGAVLSLMRASCAEFAARGVRVNAVSPGWVDAGYTDKRRARFPDGAALHAAAAEKHMLGPMAHLVEVAEAISFLLSDDASSTTGEEMFVDGGFMRKNDPDKFDHLFA